MCRLQFYYRGVQSGGPITCRVCRGSYSPDCLFGQVISASAMARVQATAPQKALAPERSVEKPDIDPALSYII